MVADPGHREIGQQLIISAETIERNRGLRGPDQIVERQHHAFGPPSRAGCIHDDRYVAAASLPHLAQEETRVRDVECAPLLLQAIQRQQAVVRIMAQTARILVDDALEMRQPVGNADQLVHLLLVLGHGEAGLRVVEHELHLVGDSVLIHRHRHPTDRLGRQHRPVKLRPVVTDDGDLVATPHAKDRKAAGDVPNGSGRRLPAISLPDAELFLAHRG